MKKVLGLMLSFIMVLALALTGCGNKDSGDQGAKDAGKDKPLKIVLVLNGNLGDKSFFDSANEGLKQIKEKFKQMCEGFFFNWFHFNIGGRFVEYRKFIFIKSGINIFTFIDNLTLSVCSSVYHNSILLPPFKYIYYYYPLKT